MPFLENMSDKEECVICCEEINKSNRKPITCPHCGVKTCISCIKRYLLDLYGDPNCMHCNVGWNNDFMRQTFPSSWISKEYKEHREKVLFDIEKARMPETQQYITATMEKSKAQQKALELANKVQDLRAAIRKAQEEHRKAQHLVSQINWYLTGQGPNPFAERPSGQKGPSKCVEKKQFIMPCPIDGCRGFLSQSWKCGVCSSHICKDCHCKKDENADNGEGESDSMHKCDPDIKASVALMKRDSKRCPTCGSVIYRIEGCDQMWCTQCCNAFSWNTGRVQKGTVHNPHYFEWLRSQGEDPTRAMRDMRVINCGARFIDGRWHFGPTVSKIVQEAFRLLRHMDQVELPKFRITANNEDVNRDLRISYMIGVMSEKEFKMFLQKKEKERSKKMQLRGVLQMFVDVVDELLRRCYETKNDDVAMEMEQFRRYTNRCFRSIAKQYQSQTAGLILPSFETIMWTKTNSDFYKTQMEADDVDVADVADVDIEKKERS